MKEKNYLIGHVTKLKEITEATLRHYDNIGLLKPDTKSGAGYRLYSHADLERLDEILYYRELNFSLKEIASLLQDTGDRGTVLQKQLLLLDRRQHNLSEQMTEIANAIARSGSPAPYTPWFCDRHEDMCLFSDQEFSKGELVYSRVTSRLTFDMDQEQFNTLTLKRATEKYTLENSFFDELEELYHIDCDALPFIRRSNKPNLIQDPNRSDIYLIATRDIKSGSELTR